MADPKDDARSGATPAHPEGAVERSAARDLLDDEPSPEVVAIFLRSPGAPVAPAPVLTDEAVPVDASLIDSLTRIVTELLQSHVRESVTAAVRALAPRLVVALPADGAQDPEDAQLRSRPAQLRARRALAPSKPE